jgi:hypothetical protein
MRRNSSESVANIGYICEQEREKLYSIKLEVKGANAGKAIEY